jgi:hypothetical protein
MARLPDGIVSFTRGFWPHDPVNASRRVAWWLFGAGVFALSPIALYAPVRGNILSVICILVILLRYKTLRFRPVTYALVLFTLLLTAVPALYWGNIKLLFVLAYSLAAIVLASLLDETDLVAFTSLTSTILQVLLVGGVIGLVYVFVGGQALISFPNEDGRMNGLYLTTLSNSVVLRIIRPAGIFDEPGTFSFVICMVAALRHSLRMDRRPTWIMLSMGMITFSLAHVAYTLLHLAAELMTSSARARAFRYAVVVLGLAALAVVFIPVVNTIATDGLFQRFVIRDGNLSGDNRTALFLSAVNQLNWHVFWWGLDADCITNAAECVKKGYAQFGENPLAPLVLYGVFNAWLYYVIEIGLVAVFFVHRNFIALGLFMLLLQRPNVVAFGYSVLIFLVIRAIMRRRSPRAEETPRQSSAASVSMMPRHA